MGDRDEEEEDHQHHRDGGERCLLFQHREGNLSLSFVSTSSLLYLEGHYHQDLRHGGREGEDGGRDVAREAQGV